MNSVFSPAPSRTVYVSRPSLGHAVGAIGALGVFIAAGFACGNGTAPPSPSTLAPIMATGAARVPLTTAAIEKKCPAN